MMITKLTKEQKEQMAVYRDKWIKLGLSTDRFTKEEAQQWSDYFYENIRKKLKVPVIIAESPLSAWIIVNMFAFAEKGYAFPIKNISASVWASVSDSVWASVSDSKLIAFISPYFYGSLDANIWAFFSYFTEVLNINYDNVKSNYDWWTSTVNFGPIFPLDSVCVISQKPVEINQIGTRLHADGKPAVKYADGFSVWALNGVRVPQYLAETPASSLDIDFFKKEQNADIKAEFIRKYGIERMVSLGKLIDTWENHEGTHNFEWYKKSEYKLIDMSAIFTTYAYLPYLYMKNQTVPGIYHLECCYNPNSSKQPQTILEGLKVRLNGIDPESLEITAIA